MSEVDDASARLAAFGTDLVEIHDWLRRQLAELRADVKRYLNGRGGLPHEFKAHCLAFCSALRQASHR